MTRAAHSTSKVAYPGTLAMLGLALAFPVALMIFDPTLMFERGWEQYVGTAIYAWAVPGRWATNCSASGRTRRPSPTLPGNSPTPATIAQGISPPPVPPAANRRGERLAPPAG